MSAPLVHRFPECTGRWNLETAAFRLYWICTRCGATGLDTTENLQSAITENLAGSWLADLTAQGKSLLPDS